MVISIQGYKGSFHDIVASDLYGEDFELLERKSFEEVFDDIASGRADISISAIENSIAGSILGNYDLLLRYSDRLTITGEYYLQIHQQLMAKAGESLSGLKEVWSHPMALKQCDLFLRTLSARRVETEDTALSAKRIHEEGLEHIGAIAPLRAAKLYNLEILAPNIETDPENYTRFLILERKNDNQELHNKTSLVFEAPHAPGALATVLGILAKYGANMSKIESRPIIGAAWEYRFYVDYEFDGDAEYQKKMLDEFIKEARNVVILGSYPKGTRHQKE